MEAENPQEPKDGGGAIKEDEPVYTVALSFVKEECKYLLKIFQEAMPKECTSVRCLSVAAYTQRSCIGAGTMGPKKPPVILFLCSPLNKQSWHSAAPVCDNSQ